MDWDTRLQIALDCARGLGALHAENLVHGKFEPSNVLLDRNRKVRMTACCFTLSDLCWCVLRMCAVQGKVSRGWPQ